MKKIFVFFILFFATFSLHTSYGAWYGSVNVSKGIGAGATWCPTDGDFTGGSPDFGGYTYDSRAVGDNGTSMTCQYWDGQGPSASVTYGNGWTNGSTANINYSASDRGGSGLQSYSLQRRVSTNAPSFSNWGAWATVSTGGGSYTLNGTDGSAYQFQVVAVDNAGNTSVISSSNILKFDRTPPSPSDVVFSVPTNLLATNAYNYEISVGNNNGSNINLIRSLFEKFDSISSYDNLVENASQLNYSWNISNVDSQRETTGQRVYEVRVTQLCDEAGNCWSGNISKNHNVFANTYLLSNKKVSSQHLSDINNVADGTQKDITLELSDIYGNDIVSSSIIGRYMNIDFQGKNTMFLNQFSRAGSKSVFINSTLSPSVFTEFSGNTFTLTNQTIQNGVMDIGFKFYTPTKNSSFGTISDVNAEFQIDNITVDILGSLGQNLGVAIDTPSIVAQMQPMYKIDILGDLKNNGLIEGINQQSTLKYEKNNFSVRSANGNQNFIKFNSGATSKYDLFYQGGVISESTSGVLSSLTQLFLNIGDNAFTTKLKLINPPAPAQMKGIISTHMTYELDGKTIVLNSGVIGQQTYWGGDNDDFVNQSALKIVGLTSNQAKVNEIIDGQKQETNIIGKIEKSSLKKEIVKNAYSAVKNIGYKSTDGNTITNEISSSSNAGKKVNNVIYFGGDSGFSDSIFSVGNVGTSLPIKGKNTIVVMGGNLYIKSNLYYENANSILGIIVLKDKSGKGGNIYIDPSVTNISATLFAEKSLISYNGTELDGNSNQSILKNQLHIYGSVFSENTLGGSKKTPFECPAYAKNACLTDEIAQKYDFNYLRRYYLITKSGKQYPANSAKVSGGGTCDTLGVCTGGDTRFKRNIVNTNTDVFAKYPVVIEYNASFQLTPPPLFNIK